MPLARGTIRTWDDAVLGLAIAGTLAAASIAAAALAAPYAPRFADKSPNAVPVDVELVIAVDVSYSMDPEEQALQREGYIQALTSKEFLRALREGPNGKIAITYFEWAGQSDQKIVMPWRLIDGPEAADAVAAEIGRAPYRRASRTSISGALRFGKPLFDTSGYRGLRRVIDVSGDGANNNGPLVVPTRDDVLAAGITINGLPIMLKRPNITSIDIDELDVYYEDCVTAARARSWCRSASGRNSSRRRAPSWCWKSPAASRRRASFRRVPTSRASRAPSARRCGRTAGAAAWIFSRLALELRHQLDMI